MAMDLIPVTKNNTLVNDDLIRDRIHSAHQKGENLVEKAKRSNSERAKKSDTDYFWKWSKIAFNIDTQYPIPEGLVYTFVAEHLNGLDVDVDKQLCVKPDSGSYKAKPLGKPHKLSTVKRRISSLVSTCKDMDAKFDSKDIYTNPVKKMLSAAHDLPGNTPTQKDAITLDVLDTLVDYIDVSQLKGLMLRCILSIGFASGGRRRSELVGITLENIKKYNSDDGFYYLITMDIAKNYKGGDKVPEVPVKGLAAIFLNDWLSAATITEGFLFRSITRTGKLGDSLSAEWIRQSIKELQIKAGLEHLDLSPHSLRSGFVTECGLKNVPAVEGMRMSLHRTESTYNRYYRAGEVVNNRAADFMNK